MYSNGIINFGQGGVRSINGSTGDIVFAGISGIFIERDGNTIYVGNSGIRELNTLVGQVTIVGSGLTDVWVDGQTIQVHIPVQSGTDTSGIVVINSAEGPELTFDGNDGIVFTTESETHINVNLDLEPSGFLQASGVVLSLNSIQDNISLLAGSGIDSIVENGQNIYINSSGADPSQGGAAYGAMQFDWKFNISPTEVNPGNKKWSMNGTSWGESNKLFVNDINNQGGDVSNIFSLLRPGNLIYIQQAALAARFGLYEINDTPTDNIGWWTLPVTPVASGLSAPGNNDVCGWLLLGLGEAVHTLNGLQNDINIVGSGDVTVHTDGQTIQVGCDVSGVINTLESGYVRTGATSGVFSVGVNEKFIFVDGTYIDTVATLPAVASVTIGKQYIIKRTDSGSNDTFVSGVQTIDKGLNAQLTQQYEAISIFTDGTEWWIY